MPIADYGPPHEAADGCASFHCHGCNLDHDPIMPAWLWCIECGHAYRTPGELRRAHRRELWLLLREHSRLAPWLVSNEWYPSIITQLWRIATVRASRIAFCHLCLHDF